MFYTTPCSPSGVRPRPGESRQPMRTRAFLALSAAVAAVAIIPQATAAADPGVAALQIGLRAHGLYRGPIDGLTGPATTKAIRHLQAPARIAGDGVVGPETPAGPR